MDKKLSKINWKWLILFLLLGFIGWQLYSQKPSTTPLPPQLTLEEQGYKKFLVLEGGPKFRAGDEICILSVKGDAWWEIDNYTLGDKIASGVSGKINTNYPMKVWVKNGTEVEITWMKF